MYHLLDNVSLCPGKTATKLGLGLWIVFEYFKFHSKQDAVNAILENDDCIVPVPTGGWKD